jgi:RimJ/RimL family protein N-acetyltransferase
MTVIGTTERLRMEVTDVGHAADLVRVLDDPRVGTHIGGPDVTTVEAMVERIGMLRAGPPEHFDEDRWLNFVVRCEEGVCGRLEATTYPDGWAEIAYVFGPAFWGHGYATEGVQWLMGHLAEVYGITELWAAVHPDNAASIRLLGRAGFTETAVLSRPVGSYDDGDLVFARLAPTG